MSVARLVLSRLRMRILAICGSLQARSGNLALLQVAVRLAPSGVEVIPFDGLRDLPLFNPDLEIGDGPPAVRLWRRAVSDADALLVASPEYGRSLTGALKNGTDWLIGSGELYRKIVAITAAVRDPRRGLKGLSALAQTLGSVEAVIVWNEPTVSSPGGDAAIARILQHLIDAVTEARGNRESPTEVPDLLDPPSTRSSLPVQEPDTHPWRRRYARNAAEAG
jgi:chromate reductase